MIMPVPNGEAIIVSVVVAGVHVVLVRRKSSAAQEYKKGSVTTTDTCEAGALLYVM